MKRRKTMLLCVTATSMAAVVGCTPAEGPVGKVGRPDYAEPDASSEDAAATQTVQASPPVGVEPAPILDAGKVGKIAVERDAGKLPEFHPDRVGTTAVVDDDVSPTVGTTARVPDKKK